MERNNDKKVIELGKFIVEFVNIDRTEAAIKFLMEYIRSYFSFSDSFVKEVMKNIPLLSDRCGKFCQEQLDYFSLLYNRYCILDETLQHIDRPKYDGRVTINDDGEPVLKISEMEDKEWEIVPEYNKPVSLQLERIEKYLDLDRSAKGTGKYFINKLQNNTLETEKLMNYPAAELTGYQNSSNCTCWLFFEAKLRGIYPKRLNFEETINSSIFWII